MRAFRKVVQALLVVFVALLMLFGQAQAAESCHQIKAKGEGQDLGGGQYRRDHTRGGTVKWKHSGAIRDYRQPAPLQHHWAS